MARGFKNGVAFLSKWIGGGPGDGTPGTNQNTKPIEPYIGNPDYNFDYDIADQATKWIKMQKAVAPDKPFFCYYAPGAYRLVGQSPHHQTVPGGSGTQLGNR